MNAKERANICLFCTKEECVGSAACYREQKRLYQRKYQAAKRRGEAALAAICNREQANETRKELLRQKRKYNNESD